MPWSQDGRWEEIALEEEQVEASFKERGDAFLVTWADNALKDKFELRIRIGYASDMETNERQGAMVGISINKSPSVAFFLPELEFMIAFLKSHHATYRETKPEFAPFEEEYKETLMGFIESLESALREARQFDIKHLN